MRRSRAPSLSLVCVGTPSRRNGALGLAAIEAVSTEIGEAIRSKQTRHEIVVRSTVLPGTTRNVVLPRLVAASGKTLGDAFGLAFNPEFMREGSSVADFNTPSRTIVGALEAEIERGGAFALQPPARRARSPPTSKPPSWPNMSTTLGTP